MLYEQVVFSLEQTRDILTTAKSYIGESGKYRALDIRLSCATNLILTIDNTVADDWNALTQLARTWYTSSCEDYFDFAMDRLFDLLEYVEDTSKLEAR